MSYYAFCTTTNLVVHADEPHLFGRQDLICPSCKCVMHYRSVSSNGRAAHFCGKHNDGCKLAAAKKEQTDQYDYVLPKNSIQGVLDIVVSQGVKKPAAGSHTHTNVSHNTSSRKERKRRIDTIRKLYNFFESADPNMILPEGVRVADVYCCEKTASNYPGSINGMHLMRAQYNGSDPGTTALFFAFPSLENKQFCIAVWSNEKKILEAVKDTIKKGDYVLIFATFAHKHCTIESEAQVVPIKAIEDLEKATRIN